MAGTSNFAGISFGSKSFDTQNLLKRENVVTCNKWSKNNMFFETCNLTISNNTNKQTIVEGIIKDPLRSQLLSLGKQVYIQYWAPSPPDYRQSFSGTGLPFPNEEVAYSNSPNIGRAVLGRDGSFVIKLQYPNSYYKKMGSEYVKPHVKILFNDENGNMYGKIINVSLGEGIPYRSLTFPEKRNWIQGPLFYKGNDTLPARTAYDTFTSFYYPVREYNNFWGLRPRN